jgi:TonB family protein
MRITSRRGAIVFFVCLGIALVALAVALGTGFAQTPGSSGKGTPSILVHVEELAGEQYSGFTQSCLLVYADGRYHREIRHQEHADGRAWGDWLLPQAFEGVLRADDLERLREIVESDSFRVIAATVGDPATLRDSIVFNLRGVTPEHDLDILAASVSHPTGSQGFEVLRSTPGLRMENSFKLFVRWIDEVEKRKEGQLDKAAANRCATSSSPRGSSLAEPTTPLTPRPIYTPPPDSSINQGNANYSGTVVVQAVVNGDGSVGPVSVKHGIDPELDQAALASVRKWRFSPARLHGMAIPALTDIEVHFFSKP